MENILKNKSIKRCILIALILLIILNVLIPVIVEAVPDVQEKSDFFDENITFSSQFIENEYNSGDMSYALYTPSSASQRGSIPMLVWLHGSGERRNNYDENGNVTSVCSKEAFLNRGLPNILNEWKTEGFKAYIVCPQLKGYGEETKCNSDGGKKRLKQIIDKIISTYNIDKNNIVIAGHSLGGQGTLYMTHPSNLGSYFAKSAVLSGIAPGITVSEIKVPTVCYTGTNDIINDRQNYPQYMNNVLIPAFGQQNCKWVETNHGGVPKAAFTLDDGSFKRNKTEIIVQI